MTLSPTVRNPPVLHQAVLCSYVVCDDQDRPFSLNEPLFGIAVVPAADGTCPAPDLELYAQFDDEHAIGTHWLTVVVRYGGSDRAIAGGRFPATEVTFTGDFNPLTGYEHVFTLRGLVLPAPGCYDFHVMCNENSLHERGRITPPPRLYVIPAERPTGD